MYAPWRERFESKNAADAERSRGERRMKDVGKDEEPDLVFFDGDCTLCQRSVLFLLRRDPEGRRFRFGSQQGETFERTVPLGARTAFAGSLVVVTPRQRVEIRSGAVVRLLHRLGGGWSVLGLLLSWVPLFLRDRTYDLVAWARNALPGSDRGKACAMIPVSLRGRFLA